MHTWTSGRKMDPGHVRVSTLMLESRNEADAKRDEISQ